MPFLELVQHCIIQCSLQPNFVSGGCGLIWLGLVNAVPGKGTREGGVLLPLGKCLLS